MIDAEERAAMNETVRGALADAVANDGKDIDGVLASLGWLDLLGEEQDDALGIVFGALGATNAVATALDDVMAVALGCEPSVDLAVALPRFASWEAPARIEGGRVHARGLASGRAAHAREVLVVCAAASGTSGLVVPMAAAETRPVRGVDPAGGLHEIEVSAPVAEARELGPVDWANGLALGRRAAAHQIEGACRAMLDLARSHALDRQQFGRPIARFQAVRHKLAEALVAVESLEAALSAARETPGAETAALAKAVAGRTARTVTRHCQQVLAGVGFTTEHAYHRYLKRTMVLEGLFGSADSIALEVGRRLLAERRVPTLIEL